MSTEELEKAVVRTAAFFSVLEYPLTIFNVWKWLMRVPGHNAGTLEEVHNVFFTCLELQDRLKSDEVWRRYRHGVIDASRKWKKVKIAARYFRMLPTVRAVFVCNTLAWSNTTQKSDVDLFFVTRPGCLWLTRALAVLPFALLGLRPKPGARDPFCFSFFASEDALDFRGLRLGNPDLYLAQWILSLQPVFDRGGVQKKILQENSWVREVFPGGQGAVMEEASLPPTPSIPSPVFFRFFESFARRLEAPRLPAEIRSMANRDSRVIVTDQILKFHVDDRRVEFFEKWKETEIKRDTSKKVRF
jgi:hypothetical protein